MLNGVAAGRTLFLPQCLICTLWRCGANLDNYTTVIANAAHFSVPELSRPLSGSLAVQNRWVPPWLQFFLESACAASPLHDATPTPGTWTSGPSRQIELALLLALSQSFFSVSSETWRQRRGVPIGGTVSKILCSVVMGASETRRNEDQVRRESLGFGGKTTLPTSVTWMIPSS